ncbi:MAG TPA: NUDIX domain-containing protein [Candidatus Limnocylindria bacterium]|nr:NUDIX domain-containing protein [Candidatus Limnocylindria bacterium]
MFTPYILMLLEHNNTILLLRRHNVSFGSGFYSLPGGKINVGEPARQAAIREAHEELGITIAENDLTFTHIFHRKGQGEDLFAIVFKVTAWHGNPVNKEPEKHDDLQWFAWDKLPANILPAHRQALELIHKNISYSEHGW